MRSTLRRKNIQRARRLTAITAVVSLIAGALALGVTAQTASAALWAPTISAQNVDPASAGKEVVLAGENVGFDVDVTNSGGGAQFNLSLVAAARSRAASPSTRRSLSRCACASASRRTRR